MGKKFDVDYFINKFSKIPEENWLTGFLGEEGFGVHCALGHCGVHGEYKETKESKALGELILNSEISLEYIHPHLNDPSGRMATIFEINDSGEGSRPKENILNVLTLIKNKS